jgi:hypothetical protein
VCGSARMQESNRRDDDRSSCKRPSSAGRLAPGCDRYAPHRSHPKSPGPDVGQLTRHNRTVLRLSGDSTLQPALCF